MEVFDFRSRLQLRTEWNRSQEIFPKWLYALSYAWAKLLEKLLLFLATNLWVILKSLAVVYSYVCFDSQKIRNFPLGIHTKEEILEICSVNVILKYMSTFWCSISIPWNTPVKLLVINNNILSWSSLYIEPKIKRTGRFLYIMIVYFLQHDGSKRKRNNLGIILDPTASSCIYFYTIDYKHC